MINLVGDPVDMLVNPESLPDEIERVRRDFGLDQPVHIQAQITYFSRRQTSEGCEVASFIKTIDLFL